MALLDYAGIMRGGQSLVPDLRQQMMERELLDMQKGQVEVQRTNAALKQAEAIREAQEREAFQRDLDAALLDGSPQAIQRLMLRYPSMADDIKPAWEAMDERQRQTDLTQLGTLYARAQAGDLDGAAAMLRSRIEADRAAGVADPADEAVLAGLESGDPIQQRAAMATMGIQLAALTGDKFAETYGKLNPTDAKTNVQKEYDWRVASFGQEAADRWLATQDESLVAVEPGGSVYRKSDFVGGGIVATPQQQAESRALERYFGLPEGATVEDVERLRRQRGGGPAISATGSAIESTALAAVPGARVTSRQRSPDKNRSVGGVANSFHLTDQARDFVPPAGMSMTQLATRLKGALPGFDVINEGDHVHVEPSSRGPVRVRSKQEYDKLPSGTTYIAPDGSQRVKS